MDRHTDVDKTLDSDQCGYAGADDPASGVFCLHAN